jgi:alpha-N-arabinofuranosidase
VSIPSLSVSSARGSDGKIVLSLVNTDPNKPARVTVQIAGASASKISATVLTTPAMNSHNTFEKPDSVAPAAYTGAKKKGDAWVFDLPSRSVVVATLN